VTVSKKPNLLILRSRAWLGVPKDDPARGAHGVSRGVLRGAPPPALFLDARNEAR
jgi:hypothetical protein